MYKLILKIILIIFLLVNSTGEGYALRPAATKHTAVAKQQERIKQLYLSLEIRNLYHDYINIIYSFSTRYNADSERQLMENVGGNKLFNYFATMYGTLRSMHSKALTIDLNLPQLITGLETIQDACKSTLLLLENIEQAVGKTEYSTSIIEDCNKFHASLQDLLNSVKQAPESENVNLNEIIKAAGHRLGLDKGKDYVETFQWKLDLSGDEVITKFPTYFKNVWQYLFENIFNNALFHGFILDGGRMKENATIKVVSKVEDNNVIIIISDNGKGMPKEASDVVEPQTGKQLVFTEQYSEFKTHNAPGHGLGLALCWDIVTSHGGRIEAQSELNKGTMFIIRLPIGVSKNRFAEISIDRKAPSSISHGDKWAAIEAIKLINAAA